MGTGDRIGLSQRVPRVRVELKVEYRRLDTFFQDYTKNISKGGMFIKTQFPLEIGTRCHFSLWIPGRTEPFQLEGEVIWSNDVTGACEAAEESSGMGIRFCFPSRRERIEFEAEVKGLVRQEFGDDFVEQLEDVWCGD